MTTSFLPRSFASSVVRSFGSSGVRSFATTTTTTTTTYKFVPPVSPTAYNPKIENVAINPQPGRRINGLYFIFGLAAIMFVLPCISNTMSTRAYYKKNGKYYTEGWSIFHYNPKY